MATNGGSSGAAITAAPVGAAADGVAPGGAASARSAPFDDAVPFDLLAADERWVDPERFLTEWELFDAFPELVTEPTDATVAVAAPAGVAGLVLAQGHTPQTGPGLATALAGVDLDGCDDHQLIEAVAQWERLAAWASERALAAVAELARRPVGIQLARPGSSDAQDQTGDHGEGVQDLAAMRASRAPLGEVAREFAGNELAARLKVSRRAADAKITLGTALAARLPGTRAALADGRVDLTRARVISERTGVLDDEQARTVDAQVVDAAAGRTPAQLRTVVDRAVLATDAAAAARRAQHAKADRSVSLLPLPDGVGELVATLPAADAVAIDTVINAAAAAMRATGGSDETRSMDQLRADALAAPFLNALATGELDGITPVRLARHRGRRAAVALTVPATTLLGLTDEPGELVGYGVVDAATARAIASDPDATWRRILTDPTSGTVLDVGTRLYRPPAGLARHVQTRDACCVAPGCSVPAAGCDLDHTVAFPHGRTAAANLAPRCRRDHRWKQSAGVKVAQQPDGATRWTTATGHVYDIPAHQAGPVSHSAPADLEPEPSELGDLAPEVPEPEAPVLGNEGAASFSDPVVGPTGQGDLRGGGSHDLGELSGPDPPNTS